MEKRVFALLPCSKDARGSCQSREKEKDKRIGLVRIIVGASSSR
jgi:hypothetical protein